MLVVHHPDQTLHAPERAFRTGRYVEYPDRAERCGLLLEAVREDNHPIVEAPLGGEEAIAAVHTPDYLHFLKTVYQRWAAHPDYGPEVVPNVHPTHRMYRKPTELLGELGWYSNSTSCPMTAGTWPAVFASAHVAIHGAARLGPERAVYALCRPPGHHAYPDLLTGVCFLNNAAIAATALGARFGKVAIVDIDVHHGNGTQFIFWNRADVLVCSIHVDPSLAAPYYAGYAEEIGEGEGRGTNFNQPLAPGTVNAPWLTALDAALARVAAFAPGALVVSLGFDAAEHDPVAMFRIDEDGFREAGRKLAAPALPTLLVQEGGYISPRLGRYLQAFLRGFEGR